MGLELLPPTLAGLALTRDQIIGPAIAIVVVVACVVFFILRRRAAGKKPKAPLIADPKERLEHALAKTRGGLLDGLRRRLGSGIDEGVLDSLEEILLRADIGVSTTQRLLDGLKDAYRKGELGSQDEVLEFLKRALVERLGGEHPQLAEPAQPPTVILVTGVNGAGKTTSIAKLAKQLTSEGKSVLLCAADTFRAAAVEQLTTWAERLGVEIVTGAHQVDPASVAHDAHERAKGRGYDYLIVDTAGRLHTEKNLMRELEKIARVGKKHIPDAPHEVLLVLDATTGQNAVRQAKAFQEALNVTGIFLAKLDGTAKGGIVVVIREELGIPVKFVGTGERPEDVNRFDAEQFVDALFA